MSPTQEELVARLKKLMLRPDNQICSDCSDKKPTWASLIVPPKDAPSGSEVLGAFCCLACSGAHRGLGTHISFVRSVTLDSWKEKEVLAMERGGNKRVNAVFEARWFEKDIRPTAKSDLSKRQEFIREKYNDRKWYDGTIYETVGTIMDAEPPKSPTPSLATTTSKKRRPRLQRQASMPIMASPTMVGRQLSVSRKRLDPFPENDNHDKFGMSFEDIHWKDLHNENEDEDNNHWDPFAAMAKDRSGTSRSRNGGKNELSTSWHPSKRTGIEPVKAVSSSSLEDMDDFSEASWGDSHEKKRQDLKTLAEGGGDGSSGSLFGTGNGDEGDDGFPTTQQSQEPPPHIKSTNLSKTSKSDPDLMPEEDNDDEEEKDETNSAKRQAAEPPGHALVQSTSRVRGRVKRTISGSGLRRRGLERTLSVPALRVNEDSSYSRSKLSSTDHMGRSRSGSGDYNSGEEFDDIPNGLGKANQSFSDLGRSNHSASGRSRPRRMLRRDRSSSDTVTGRKTPSSRSRSKEKRRAAPSDASSTASRGSRSGDNRRSGRSSSRDKSTLLDERLSRSRSRSIGRNKDGNQSVTSASSKASKSRGRRSDLSGSNQRQCSSSKARSTRQKQRSMTPPRTERPKSSQNLVELGNDIDAPLSSSSSHVPRSSRSRKAGSNDTLAASSEHHKRRSRSKSSGPRNRGSRTRSVGATARAKERRATKRSTNEEAATTEVDAFAAFKIVSSSDRLEPPAEDVFSTTPSHSSASCEAVEPPIVNFDGPATFGDSANSFFGGEF